MSERVDALRTALELSPENHTLRQMLVEALLGAGRAAEALPEYERLLEAGVLRGTPAVQAGELALEHGDLALSARCLEAARRSGVVAGVAALAEALDGARERAGVLRLVRSPERESAPAADAPEEIRIRFEDVGGLEDVKKVIHRSVLLPRQRPDLYEKYGRRSGGGVLLYGPPGCGKTLLARATAGECGLPFVNVRIEAILDPYVGQSERNLHAAFEYARQRSPCVIFLDELDALAFARRKHVGSASRSIVDQLLQELEAIGADNRDVLVLAATNAPWDVDDAMKRPGRFDRVIFVPPPDAVAREAILKVLLADRPSIGLDLASLAARTPLFSGADLRALVERAVDRVIEEALTSDAEPPLSSAHFEAVLAELRPTTLDWLSRAKAYVEFANRTEAYRDVRDYLATREVRAYKL